MANKSFSTTASIWSNGDVYSTINTVPYYSEKDYWKEVYGPPEGIKVIRSDLVPPGQMYTTNNPGTWEQVTYMYPEDFAKLYQLNYIPSQTQPPPPSIKWWPPDRNYGQDMDKQKFIMEEEISKLIRSKYFDPPETQPYPKPPEPKPVEDPDPQ
jgi:hypothetical protein